MSRIKQDLEDSIWNFENLFQPIIMKWLNLKKMWSIERQETEIEKVLDYIAGIDYQGLTNDNHLITLSSRVQWYPEKEYLKKFYPYNSFTIRKERIRNGCIIDKVDFLNKLTSILNDYSYPVYHSEGYVTTRRNGKVLSLALCKTKNLILYINKGNEDIDYEIKEVWDHGAARFFVIYFGESYFQKKKSLPIYNDILNIYFENKEEINNDIEIDLRTKQGKLMNVSKNKDQQRLF